MTWSALGATATQPAQQSQRGLLWQRFTRHRLAVVGAVFLLIIGSLSLAAPLVELALGLDANRVDIFNRLAPPSARHLLGTDELGRDMFLRLLYGGRVSLLVGLVVAFAAAIIGSFIGVIAGYYGGKIDTLLMRFTDAIIALPVLPLLIVLAAADLTKLPIPDAIAQSETVSLYRIIFIVALFGWTTVARLVRSATLSVRTREFVLAAQALGAPSYRIMLRHILPNVISPVVVATTLSIGGVILLESVLSFLGLGVQPPIPSWGNLLTNAQELMSSAPMLSVYPGLLIFMTVIAFNFVGDGLQDAIDPRAARG